MSLVDFPGPLPVLYQDEYLVAIDKPAGLLVHRTALARKERWFAMQMLRDQIGQHVYPLHRLDRPTSGVLLFALSSEIAAQMAEQFETHTIEKEYLAVVRGWLSQTGRLDYPLKEELDKTTDGKARQDKEAQEAVTNYQPLALLELPVPVGRYQTARYSLMALQPETGRKHQLRRHLAHLRHPIIGDTTHGDGRQNRAFTAITGCSRLMLHAQSLRFQHPVLKKNVHVQAPIPTAWQALAQNSCWPLQGVIRNLL